MLGRRRAPLRLRLPNLLPLERRRHLPLLLLRRRLPLLRLLRLLRLLLRCLLLHLLGLLRLLLGLLRRRRRRRPGHGVQEGAPRALPAVPLQVEAARPGPAAARGRRG